MKKIILLITAISSLLLSSCEQKIEYVTPTWVSVGTPKDGTDVKIDYFQLDLTQEFSWTARDNSTYTISFSTTQDFANEYKIEMGTNEKLTISNGDLLEILKELNPYFDSVSRFFWSVEQNTNGEIDSVWRYFNAVISVESFVDARDGEVYAASQFVLSDGSLLTIMAENLRATVYPDGQEILPAYKTCPTDDVVLASLVGNYYSWAAATRTDYDTAKQAVADGATIQGVCPDGWHMPTYEDFEGLATLYGKYEVGFALKNGNYWDSNSEITNSAGMGIVPSGDYWHEGVDAPDNLTSNKMTAFWTATPALSGYVYDWQGTLDADVADHASVASFWDGDNAGALVFQYKKTVAEVENHCYPVRCVMD